MSFMEHITKILEDEIEKKVNERLSLILEKLSRTYDISLRQLLRDVSSMNESTSTICKGLTAKGKRCSRIAKCDGYCHFHQKQKPIQRVERPPSVVSMTTLAHTHTLPPLFLAGCPACERGRNQSSNALLSMCV